MRTREKNGISFAIDISRDGKTNIVVVVVLWVVACSTMHTT